MSKHEYNLQCSIESGPKQGRWSVHTTSATISPSVHPSATMQPNRQAVEGTTLAFKSIHHVHGSDGLALRVLGVRDGVTDDVLQEDFEHTSGLLVDEPEMRFTPPRRARRRMAGFVMP
ncbi:hypothetical protein ECG_06053 [Echinococcus granulosus]|nr:hypothetical protein ECG_06053 [Echinococcus granulosus]